MNHRVTASLTCCCTIHSLIERCAGDAEKVGWYQGLLRRVKQLKRQVLVLYYAVQDPRVGCLPRALALAAVSCAHHFFAISLPLLSLRKRSQTKYLFAACSCTCPSCPILLAANACLAAEAC